MRKLKKFVVLLVIVWILIGCGADSDIPTQIIKVNDPHIYAASNPNIWYAEVEIVFSQTPVDLEVFNVKCSQGPSTCDGIEFNWEQSGDIVTLLLAFRLKEVAGIDEGGDPYYRHFSDFDYPYDMEFTISWRTGRKQIGIKLNPSLHIVE